MRPDSAKTTIKIRLFVSGQSPSAAAAYDNLKAVCEDPRFTSSYDFDIEVVNINESPQIAEDDKVLVTPTLVKKLPLPMRRLVGDLSNEEDIHLTLDIQSPPRPATGTRHRRA